MTARKLLSSALVLLALGGCTIAPPTLRRPIPEEARRAIALLVQRWHDFSDLRALADIRLDRGGDRQHLTGVLLARAPGSVRFEALSPFGQPFLFVTVDEGMLTAYDATRNEALVAPATAQTTAHLLSLPFDADDLVAVLAGLAVPPKDLRTAQLLAADDHGPSLELIGGLHRQRVWMDFETGVIRRLEISGPRTEALVTYRRDPDGQMTGFDLTAGQDYVTGSVQYRDPVFGGGIELGRFGLTLPNDAKIQNVR
ncbi:MAG: LolA family protein [Candidatus Rokuibacteriota bacterium]